MKSLTIPGGTRGRLRVLCIGAHCDDIEIGCGATLIGLQNGARSPVIDWAILSGSEERRRETSVAWRRLVRRANRGNLFFGEFADGRFPAQYAALKEQFESLKALSSPDLIFCHEQADPHQDHRVINEMVWSTFRDHMILEYETPRWDRGPGQPNVYVPVTAIAARAKVDVLMKAYVTQTARDWFTPDTFMAMLRLRGVECRSPSGLAEAFHGRKIRLEVR